MIQIKTLEDVQAFITNANTLLGYPDVNGTETYCFIPEITEIKDENGVVINSYYEIEVTAELQEAMIKIATEKLIEHEDTTEN